VSCCTGIGAACAVANCRRVDLRTAFDCRRELGLAICQHESLEITSLIARTGKIAIDWAPT
jgi:hypothetical protein